MPTQLPNDPKDFESAARDITNQDDMIQYVESVILFLVDHKFYSYNKARLAAWIMLPRVANKNYDLVINAFDHIDRLTKKVTS